MAGGAKGNDRRGSGLDRAAHSVKEAMGTRNIESHVGFIRPRSPRFEACNTLARCKLRASPATGLVGMRENYFLKDYFGYLGLVELTTQSEIREVIVR
ncbi:unnamed protein product, partial [Ascophyllum nodosum]